MIIYNVYIKYEYFNTVKTNFHENIVAVFWLYFKVKKFKTIILFLYKQIRI